MDKFNDRWLRIGGVLLLLLPLVINEVTSAGFHRPVMDEIFYVGFYMASVALFLEIGRQLIFKTHKRYPRLEQLKKRFSACIWQVSVSNSMLILFTFELSHWLRHMHAQVTAILVTVVGIVSLILALAQAGIYEGLSYYRRLHQVEKEKEELQRMHLQSQFDSLKQQISPHFLFNSLNTITALIDKDSAKAKRYLSEMSKVYRYLLRTSEEELTTLQTELTFVHSYFHLLKTRFTEGLILNIEVAAPYAAYYLPALTLQLLVENAVKHNRVDRNNPLTIAIYTTADGYLCVSNNLQKKTNLLASSRLGLATIAAKYKLLNQPEVDIREDAHQFLVTIPLIPSKII